MKRALTILVPVIWLIVSVIQPIYAADQAREEQLGREYSKQVEQDCRLCEDKALTDRINRIGQALAKIANENRGKGRLRLIRGHQVPLRLQSHR